MIDFLREQNIDENLIKQVLEFRDKYPLDENSKNRIPKSDFKYYGKEVWEMAITAILQGSNILLAGPKASGKNVLCDNLATLFNRPSWNISFHTNTDANSLIGTDTFIDNRVSFRPGPVHEVATKGGFGVLDEINMAKNDSISVLHSCLDHRRSIDISGYDKINLNDASRFIGTMNYGYVGTRELNEALVSRFMVIDMPEINEITLRKIIESNFNLNKEYLDLFIRLFLDLQLKSQNSEISSKPIDLRGLLSAIGIIEKGLDVKTSLKMGVTYKSFDLFERDVVNDVIDTLFKDDLYAKDIFNK